MWLLEYSSWIVYFHSKGIVRFRTSYVYSSVKMLLKHSMKFLIFMGFVFLIKFRIFLNYGAIIFTKPDVRVNLKTCLSRS